MVPRLVIVTVEPSIFQGLGGVTRSLPGIPAVYTSPSCKPSWEMLDRIDVEDENKEMLHSAASARLLLTVGWGCVVLQLFWGHPHSYG